MVAVADAAAPERTPTVSVIMVCYDGAVLLPETLASLTAQTLHDWELVFWDNGSTDGSAEIARAVGARARVFGGRERLTLGAARREALAVARGDLFAFLDHDDLWRPDKLQRQVGLMASEGAGLCYSDCHVMEEGGAHVGRYADRVTPRVGAVRLHLFEENFIPTVTVMLSRAAYDAAGPFDTSLNVPADYEQWLRVAVHASVAFDPEPLASYRLRRGGMTADLDSAYTQVASLYERLRGRTVDPVERRWLDRGRTSHQWRWALRGLITGAGLGLAVQRFISGFRVAGGPVRASADFLRFWYRLIPGLRVRVAMARARRRR